MYISIHAPAGGATPAVHVGQSIQQSISIHAPAGGATPRVGARMQSCAISIHAPAGGATRNEPLHGLAD